MHLQTSVLTQAELQHRQNYSTNIRGVAGEGGRGGSWSARDPPFVSQVISKQPTAGGENDVKI